MSMALLLAWAEEQRLQRKSAVERRLIRSAGTPLMLPETEFMSHFRLRKSEFAMLCDDLIPLLPVTQRINAVRPEIKILAALALYANGSYQKNVGAYYHLGLSQTKVSQCLKDVTKALNDPRIVEKYIRFPITRAEREAVSKKFEEKFNFPGVVGCIDGTHVAIIKPIEDEKEYLNEKQYHSLNVLLICDADLRILHVNAAYGGFCQDSYIWNGSDVLPLMMRIHEEGEMAWLLGDSGYAQRDWMMTPILNAEPNSPEALYNHMHVCTWNVIERCIGVLKTRWHCLFAHRVMHYSPVNAGKMINACVVLHNLINDSRITIDEREMRRDRKRQPPARCDEPDIDTGRQALVDRLSEIR